MHSWCPTATDQSRCELYREIFSQLLSSFSRILSNQLLQFLSSSIERSSGCKELIFDHLPTHLTTKNGRSSKGLLCVIREFFFSFLQSLAIILSPFSNRSSVGHTVGIERTQFAEYDRVIDNLAILSIPITFAFYLIAIRFHPCIRQFVPLLSLLAKLWRIPVRPDPTDADPLVDRSSIRTDHSWHHNWQSNNILST